MSAINQCTRAITGETKLMQYFRLCITCSAVGVCLNCASICHDNHILGPLQRDTFYCQCDQITNCCRALNICVASDSNVAKIADSSKPATAPTSSRKKAAAAAAITSSSNGAINPAPPSASKKRKLKQDNKPFVVWTRVTGGEKSFRDSFVTKEGADREARRLFFEENPFKMTEAELLESEAFQETVQEDGYVRLCCTLEGISWEVGCESKVDEPTAPKEKKSKLTAVKSSSRAVSESAPSVAQSAKPSAPVPAPSSAAPSKPATPVIAPSPAFNDDDDDDDVVIFAEIKPRFEEFVEEKEEKVADKAGKKKTRPKKEAGAPKGPVASFMMFSNSNRERFVAENPGLSVIEISKTIGNAWKSMTAEEKLPYEDRARADKERYAKELKDYNEKKANGELPPLVPTPAKPRGRAAAKKKNESLPIADSDSLVNQSPENNGSHVIEEDVSINSRPMELDYSDEDHRPQDVDSDSKSLASEDNQADFHVYLVYEADGDNESDSHPTKTIPDNNYSDLRQANDRVRSLALQKGLKDSIEQDESTDHGMLTINFSLPTGETWRVGVKKASSSDDSDDDDVIEL